jgi:hypothetical protein
VNPVVPHFPRPPYFRGHNSQKHRNRAGIIERPPTGTDEVLFSDVTRTENGRGCGLGGGPAPDGGYACLFLGNIRNKMEFSRAKKENRSPVFPEWFSIVIVIPI